MKLFKKKEKTPKIRDRQGCLKKLAIVSMFILVFVLGLINGINGVVKLYGEKLETVATYIKKINEPVVESEIVFNPIAELSAFNNKADDVGFYGHNNLEDTLELQSDSMTYTDQEIGAFISSKLKNSEVLLSLGEFTISSQNTIRIVYIYDLSAISSAIEKAGEIIPQKLFITVNYEFDIEQTEFFEDQIKYTVLNKQLNKLEPEISDTILGYLDKVEESENVKNPLETYDEIVFDILNTIALKTQTRVSLDVNTISFTK